jgi:hypothetical protein
VLVLRGDSLVAPGSAAALRVWVRDDRGALRPLTPGRWVVIGAGPPGDSRAPSLRYQADVGAARGRVALVYEVRLDGETQ